jgi:hypothetical protein
VTPPSNRFSRTRRPEPEVRAPDRSEHIPVPHPPVRVGRPSRAPLTRMERRRNLVHVQNILNEHFRKERAS